MKKTILMLLMLSMVLCVNIGVASAEGNDWEVIGYKLYNSTCPQFTGTNSIAEGTTINAWIDLQYTGDASNPASASDMTITRTVDNFDGGTAPANNDQNRFKYDASTGILSICITDLKYDGTGTNLSFRIKTGSSFQTININCKELKKSTAIDQWMITKYAVYSCKTDGTNGSTLSGLDTVRKGSKINVEINMKYPGTLPAGAQVTFDRALDSFNGGGIELGTHDNNAGTYTIVIRGLEYKGTGDSLCYTINTNGTYQRVSLSLVETEEYVKPTPSTPDAKPETVIPEPYGLFTRGPISDVIRANEEFDLTINIKNRGKTTMLNPVATIELSDCLMNMSGQDSFGMTNILSGSTGSITIKVKAMSAITSQAQFANVSLRFDYNNGTNIAAGNTSGKVTIPCKLSTESQSEKADSPIPNMIVTKFSYGSESVAAGSDFTFSFTFKNTSKKLDTDNIVVTVESTGFTPNGSTNTFYFSKLYSEDTKTVTLPMKANSVLNGAVEDIAINFSYEYVDKKVRHTMTSSLKVSVPVYQKDRFEISTPVAPALCYEGEEISMTMNYVNKGKSAANNVEATIEGDITSPNPTQILGNIEPGKNGQFAFALTPLMVGECNFTVTVTYEDANENIKERVFPVTLNVEAMQWEDPGEMEDPGMEEMPQEKGNLWKYIVALAALALITLLIVLRKRKKAKAIKQEANQWKAWEEEFAKEEAGSENTDTPTDKAVDEKTESSKEDK